MGAGASVGEKGGTAKIDKSKVVSHLRNEYDVHSKRASLKEEELFQHLQKEYHAVVAKTTAEGKEGPLAGDDAVMKDATGKKKSIQSNEMDKDVEKIEKAALEAVNHVAPLPHGYAESEFRKRRLSVIAKPKPDKTSQESDSTGSTFFRSADIGQKTPTPSPFPVTTVGTYSVPGIEPSWDDEGVMSKINQDRGCVVYPFASDDGQAFFAVYDGHGERGDIVSHFVMSNMYRVLEEHEKFSQDDLVEAFTDTFIRIDQMLEEKNIECTFSGTTGVAVVLRDRKFIIANCGDSRAVLGTLDETTKRIKAVNLSNDHNPDAELEKKRILEAGGYVSPPPEPGLSARVWLDPEMTQIGLAMARSIGDRAVKDIGVIAEPEITYHTLQDDDQFVILASDGVWEFIDSEEACQIVKDNMNKGSAHACQVLIENAAERWRLYEGDYRDDITAMVIKLPCFEEKQ